MRYRTSKLTAPATDSRFKSTHTATVPLARQGSAYLLPPHDTQLDLT